MKILMFERNLQYTWRYIEAGTIEMQRLYTYRVYSSILQFLYVHACITRVRNFVETLINFHGIDTVQKALAIMPVHG